MDAMIDIESLGLGPRVVVLQIGAVLFGRDEITIGGFPEVNRFSVDLDLQSQIDGGRKIDASTLMWWLTVAPEEARRRVFVERAPRPINAALADLSSFLRGVERVWARGPQFDLVNLESLYTDLGMGVPWSYRAVRDSRTLLEFAESAPDITLLEAEGPAHVGVADAAREAMQVQLTLGELNSRLRTAG